MSSPATVALRAELIAALEKLEPQIRGLDDLSKISLSPDSMAYVTREIADHRRRRSLEQSALAALDALEQDGYPEMPVSEVPPGIFDEMQDQIADLAAAFLEFGVLPQATTMTGSSTPFRDNP